MATTDAGVYYPTPADAFDPSGDQQQQAASLTPRVIVPVANEAERDALAASVSPSPTAPLYVHRADAAAGFETEYTTDGSIWRSIQAGDTGWETLTFAGGWHEYPSAGPPRVRRVGDVVHLRGAAQPDVAGTGESNSEINFISSAMSERMRPLNYDAVFVCQGSAQSRWMMRVRIDGTVSMRSYSGSSSTSSWLPFAVTWIP